jgi:hypothetical protein
MKKDQYEERTRAVIIELFPQLSQQGVEAFVSLVVDALMSLDAIAMGTER